jgi:hypothetical protein
MEKDAVGSTAWNLDYRTPLATLDNGDLSSDDECSIASDGSRITVESETLDKNDHILDLTVEVNTPASPTVRIPITNPALVETPPEDRRNMRKKPADCHVLIRWSRLVEMMKENLSCLCGERIKHIDRRTIGIATEIDFRCSSCKKEASVLADRTDYVEQKSEASFIRRERRVDSYELNWRLLMSTQLMGESQLGGSIIGLFLDLTREAFRNSWGPMEDLLGVQQQAIGKQCCDMNLLKETMGKIGRLDEDGKVRYPIDVSYDMGWQKAKKTYDSISGHGLMIGNATNNVVAFQNYSTSCGFCERHKKKMELLKTPDVPAVHHLCPKNYAGSSKGMEALAALDCVNQIWSHEDIDAFISIICLDDDATTRAYLKHSFADLAAMDLPRPLDKNGVPKTGKKNDKGKLGKDHPVITFLADLSHRVRTFAKYLYALKNAKKSLSEMNDIDCLRLKRNYAWWLFSGVSLSYAEFEHSAPSPVLHHFNDHSRCGTWCKHTEKSEDELKKLKKYRCKETNAKLYVQCQEIIERFSTPEHLQECYHRMSSQKNEAMNKSIMRYAPKDRTYARTMALTSRINLSVGIDCIGHAKYYERLFGRMHFRHTSLTFSGLRRMWRKKEYGRMYSGLKSVRLRRRLAMRTKMEKGITKMKADKTDGRYYASGMRVGGDDVEGEQPAKKKKKAPPRSNNPLLTKAQMGCKCGAVDHQRVTSKSCPWYGLTKQERLENYEKRMNEVRSFDKMRSEASATTADSTGLTTNGTVADCTVATATAPSGTGPTGAGVHNSGKLIMGTLFVDTATSESKVRHYTT